MFQKFRSRTDNDLVFEYKKFHSDDLENEIITRYQKHSKKLAAILYSKYKFLYQVEFDDLYCIVLASTFNAIRSFSNDSIDFYQYWKVTAYNDVLEYISKFSKSNNNRIDSKCELSTEPGSGFLREHHIDLEDDYLSSFELEDVLTNPKNKIKQIDADLFRLYLAGYEPLEISTKLGIEYNKVRYRIRSVRSKIANILFNQ